MIKLTTNQFAALAACTAGLYRTCQIAAATNMTWHSANVALKALALKGLLNEDRTPNADVAAAEFNYASVAHVDRTKRVSRRQFAALLAVMADNTRICEIAAAGNMPWHSANVALGALYEKGFTWHRDGATVAPLAFNGLRAVTLTLAA